MNNSDILTIAMQQSAIDSNCVLADFLRADNVVVRSCASPNARRYLKLPHSCDLTSYGNNIVATVSGELEDIVKDYIGRYDVENCYETPNLHLLMDKIRPLGLNVCFMAEYFLPSSTHLSVVECRYATRVLMPSGFAELYLPEWSNAINGSRKHLDSLAIGAYDGDRLVGLAGASADCDTMWQIGIDVLADYRRQGIASALTNQLAREVLARGIVPFYCCSWANIKSARNAIKSGFIPSWVQLTVKPTEEINAMLRS